jgi:hypothetical protein
MNKSVFSGEEVVMDDDDELVTCGTVAAWSKKLGITEEQLLERLQPTKAIKCRDREGRVLDSYPEFYVREKCADLLADE